MEGFCGRFFAEKKQIIETSFPGDIVGLHDNGNFKIGDTITEGEKINYKGITIFSPEHFRYINNADPMKGKQLQKGIDQLMDEGVAQLFTLELNVLTLSKVIKPFIAIVILLYVWSPKTKSKPY